MPHLFRSSNAFVLSRIRRHKCFSICMANLSSEKIFILLYRSSACSQLHLASDLPLCLPCILNTHTHAYYSLIANRSFDCSCMTKNTTKTDISNEIDIFITFWTHHTIKRRPPFRHSRRQWVYLFIRFCLVSQTACNVINITINICNVLYWFLVLNSIILLNRRFWCVGEWPVWKKASKIDKKQNSPDTYSVRRLITMTLDTAIQSYWKFLWVFNEAKFSNDILKMTTSKCLTKYWQYGKVWTSNTIVLIFMMSLTFL